MILYDVVLEDLPERVRELTVRLRDMVLSLGGGISEHVGRGVLEYSLGWKQPFVVLAPDRTGASLRFPGPFDKALGDHQGRLTLHRDKAEMRLASASDIDDHVRRVVHELFCMAQTRAGARRQVEDGQELDEGVLEALHNLSRSLRLLCHHVQVQQKVAKQKAVSAAKASQKRSHKKKPPPVPPPLLPHLGGPNAEQSEGPRQDEHRGTGEGRDGDPGSKTAAG